MSQFLIMSHSYAHQSPCGSQYEMLLQMISDLHTDCSRLFFVMYDAALHLSVLTNARQQRGTLRLVMR